MKQLMQDRLPSYAVNCLLAAGYDSADVICSMNTSEEPDNSFSVIENFIDQCFLEYKSAGENSTSESIIKETVINSCMIKEFTLTDECKRYISENITGGNSQAIEPTVITDDSDDERETLPKWLTINATILYQSDKIYYWERDG